MNTKLLRVIYILLLILGTQIFSELFLVKNSLYYIFPWLDIPMHIWGGFLIGILYYCYSDYSMRDGETTEADVKLIDLLVFVVLIGVLWELYEYVSDIYHIRDWGGFVDTFKDICDDIIGGLIAYGVTRSNK